MEGEHIRPTITRSAAARKRRLQRAVSQLNDDGTRLRPGQMREHLWAAQRRAGLRQIPWHGLRHSFASVLVSGGAPLRVVQRWLGHSSITTSERYGHLAPGAGDNFISLL